MKTKWLHRVIPRLLVIGLLIASLAVPVLVNLPAGATSIANPISMPKESYTAPADCYWVGGTGNWSDATNHWATTSNGLPNILNLPDATSNVHFDSHSFSGAGQVVIVDVTANCLNMDWTGATNSPRLGGASILYIYGDLTLISAMTVTNNNALIAIGSVQRTWTTNNLDLSSTNVFGFPHLQQLTVIFPPSTSRYKSLRLMRMIFLFSTMPSKKLQATQNHFSIFTDSIRTP